MKFVVTMGSDRRTAERQSLAVGTLVEAAEPAIVLIDEISTKGFRVVAAAPFTPGEDITIELPAICERAAAIAHKTGMRFGCLFEQQLTEEELRQIVSAGAAQHAQRKERAANGWRPGVTAVAA